MTDSLPKTWRELRGSLARMGATRLRCKGSHEIWRFDDGDTFIVVVNHQGDGIPKGIVTKFERLVARQRARQSSPNLKTASPWKHHGVSSRSSADKGAS